MATTFNLKEAIIESLTTLGGYGTSSQVREVIKSKYGKDWNHIEDIMADLCPESKSAFFAPEDRILKQIGGGKYSLQGTLPSEPTEPNASGESERPLGSQEQKPPMLEDGKEISKKLEDIQISVDSALVNLRELEKKMEHMQQRLQTIESLLMKDKKERS